MSDAVNIMSMLNSVAYMLLLFLCDCSRALSLASPEIRFHIDSETHDPIEVQAKQLL